MSYVIQAVLSNPQCPERGCSYIDFKQPGQIDFANVRLGGCTVQDYVLYRVAKGICSGMLGATSEELADPELVSDDTLRLILCAAAAARYGPEVIKVGRTEA